MELNIHDQTINASTQPLYDLSSIKAISRGNDLFVEKMVNMFIDLVPAMVTEMEQHFLQNNLKAMSEVAHKIKPVVDNLGILIIKDPIRQIEKIGSLEISETSIPQLLSLIKLTIDQVAALLKIEFSV